MTTTAARVSPAPPQQARSAARRAAILDAAHAVLVGQGVAAVTTTAVARAAAVPVGSVYRHFADKAALLDELAVGYLEQFDALARQLAGDPGAAADPVLSVFDGYVELIRSSPGFRALWMPGQLSEATQAADRASTAQVAELLADVVVGPGAEVGPQDLLRCQVAVEAADALLKQAFRRAPEGDEAYLEEARRLLHLYAADAGYVPARTRVTDRD